MERQLSEWEKQWMPKEIGEAIAWEIRDIESLGRIPTVDEVYKRVKGKGITREQVKKYFELTSR